MKKTVQLVTKADIPNINGVVFPSEVLKKMVEKLNENREIPLQIGYGDFEPKVNIEDIVGMSIPGTAKFNDGKINIDFQLTKEAFELLKDEEKFTIGSHLICRCEENEVKIDEPFNFIYMAILPRDKCEVKNEIKS